MAPCWQSRSTAPEQSARADSTFRPHFWMAQLLMNCTNRNDTQYQAARGFSKSYQLYVKMMRRCGLLHGTQMLTVCTLQHLQHELGKEQKLENTSESKYCNPFEFHSFFMWPFFGIVHLLASVKFHFLSTCLLRKELAAIKKITFQCFFFSNSNTC